MDDVLFKLKQLNNPFWPWRHKDSLREHTEATHKLHSRTSCKRMLYRADSEYSSSRSWRLHFCLDVPSPHGVNRTCKHTQIWKHFLNIPTVSASDPKQEMEFARPLGLEACVKTCSIVKRRSFFTLVVTLRRQIALLAEGSNPLFRPLGAPWANFS